MASQITGFPIVCSIVCSGADHRKYQSSASLAFVRGIHQWPVVFPHKGPVTRKTFPFDGVVLTPRCHYSMVQKYNTILNIHGTLWLQKRHLITRLQWLAIPSSSPSSPHYNDVTWASWRLSSLTLGLFVQNHVQDNVKDITKHCNIAPLCGYRPVTYRVPSQKPVMRKTFPCRDVTMWKQLLCMHERYPAELPWMATRVGMAASWRIWNDSINVRLPYTYMCVWHRHVTALCMDIIRRPSGDSLICISYVPLSGPVAHFTNDFYLSTDVNRSLYIFAHATTAELSWHVQTFAAILLGFSTELRWKTDKDMDSGSKYNQLS